VLDKGKLTGARLARWLELTRSSDSLVRQRALALLAKHPEVKDGQAVLAQAIGEGSPGVLSVAARLIVDHPELAGSGEEAPRSAPAPAPELIRALSSALDQNRPADQVEPRAAVIEAMGTLQLLSAKATVEKYCGHRNPTLREAARRALGRLGDAQRDCIDLGGGAALVANKLADKPATLTFVTDAGRLGLTLHPQHAPAAVARVVDLARRGFYNGLEVHVRGGSVVQFGDPTGDGYGGSGTDPLPSETSPLSFDAFRVGMAQSGRDTGSSQVFVTLTPQPRLSGDYPLIGWADPEWALISDGDRIREVIVKE
jgi:cyclophilin family peptidyl-prolyl cis-trans isomerase